MRAADPAHRAARPPGHRSRGSLDERTSRRCAPTHVAASGGSAAGTRRRCSIPALDELDAAWTALRDDPGFRDELGTLARDFVGRPTPITHAQRLSEELGVRHLAEAGGPGAHGRPQDQQRARPGAARQTTGQGADHRRDRGGPARRRDRDRLCAARLPVRRVHGRGGHPPAGAERRPDGAARRRGRAGDGGLRDAQGGRERGPPRLGGERQDHPLHHRVGRRAAPLPAARARPPAGDRRRGSGAVRRTGRRRSRVRGRLRGRRIERDRDVHGVRRRPGRAADRVEAGGRGSGLGEHCRRSPSGSPASSTAPSATCCRTRTGRSSRRTRSPRVSTTRASVPSTPSSRTRASPPTPAPPTTTRSRGSRSWRGPRASCPRSSPRT